MNDQYVHTDPTESHVIVTNKSIIVNDVNLYFKHKLNITQYKRDKIETLFSSGICGISSFTAKNVIVWEGTFLK